VLPALPVILLAENKKYFQFYLPFFWKPNPLKLATARAFFGGLLFKVSYGK
jgi:hypothetical protein